MGRTPSVDEAWPDAVKYTFVVALDRTLTGPPAMTTAGVTEIIA